MLLEVRVPPEMIRLQLRVHRISRARSLLATAATGRIGGTHHAATATRLNRPAACLGRGRENVYARS